MILMTHGLSKDIRRHTWHLGLYLHQELCNYLNYHLFVIIIIFTIIFLKIISI